MTKALLFVGLPVATLVAALFAVLATGIVAAWLRDRRVLDRPNERSSHDVPTPRGGGLALLPVVLGAWIVLPLALGQGVPPALPPLAIGAGLLMVVCFLDDLRGLPPWPRLAAQAAAVALGLSALPTEALVLQGWLPFWLDRLLAALAWLWFVNLFNFMDGIDGISGVEATGIGAGLALLGALGGLPLPPAVAGLLLAAACLGFLAWNWHPARLFLGDVGSVPLGYLLGFLLLTTAAAGQLWAALILPAYYLADASLTLLRRARRRAPLLQAHREHFYQRAAAAVGHARVATAVALTDLLLIGCALLTLRWGALALVPAALATLGLMAWMARQARRPAA